MNFYNIFKSILGIPDTQGAHRHTEENIPNGIPNEFRNPIWNDEDDDYDEDFRALPRSSLGFRIFSNPIEMHRYFEHQMDEMMRHFQELESPDIFGAQDFPSLGSPQGQPNTESKGTLRSQLLKPEFDRESGLAPGYTNKKKRDSDLDDRVRAGDLDKILEGTPPLDPGVSTVPRIRTYGKSMVSKTIRMPDGTLEHHRTVRDNDGNEETTITRQIGDQSHSITTKTDAGGEQIRIENFVNLEEAGLGEFQKKWGGQHLQPHLDEHGKKPRNWFPIDKFFK